MSFTTSTFDHSKITDDTTKSKCYITLVKYSEDVLKLLEGKNKEIFYST